MNALEALNQHQQQTSGICKQKQNTEVVNIHKTENCPHFWRCWVL